MFSRTYSYTSPRLASSTRKWHKDKQSDDRNDDHHDDHLRVVEALAADHQRGGNIALACA